MGREPTVMDSSKKMFNITMFKNSFDIKKRYATSPTTMFTRLAVGGQAMLHAPQEKNKPLPYPELQAEAIIPMVYVESINGNDVYVYLPHTDHDVKVEKKHLQPVQCPENTIKIPTRI